MGSGISFLQWTPALELSFLAASWATEASLGQSYNYDRRNEKQVK